MAIQTGADAARTPAARGRGAPVDEDEVADQVEVDERTAELPIGEPAGPALSPFDRRRGSTPPCA